LATDPGCQAGAVLEADPYSSRYGVNGSLVSPARIYIDVVATIEDVRRIALDLPRAYEALVGDRVKFRVGRLVFASVSRDETQLGFGFPREERAALVASDPDKFMMPLPSDERYQWVRLRLAAVDEDELSELVVDAWRMCVPKKVAAAYLGD
jgi:hypothetical protein